MDEDVKDYRADTGRLAAEAGITLTDEALDGIASLREEGAAGHARLKERLRANTGELVARGGFGTPTLFVNDTDMYFGNDRLVLVESALGGGGPFP